MPVISTEGAASAKGYGFSQGAKGSVNYIEDVFSTYLYNGNGSTQTITNGIDLSTKGGLVWTKDRTSTTAGRNYHRLNDSVRGITTALETNLMDAEDNLGSGSISSFDTTGYSLGGSTYNYSGDLYVSWTFAKQKKFFDIVTYTGTGSAQNIAHNLGSTPGCIIIKSRNGFVNWSVYHRSTGNTKGLYINTTAAATTSSAFWNNTSPTDTQFTVGTDTTTNNSGDTYVAYLFAHDAGGFGTAGTDNVISCGSYVGNGSDPGPTITLGYEPQWVLIKNTSRSGQWCMVDTMRGMSYSSYDAVLYSNLTNAETNNGYYINPNSTGFQLAGANQPGNSNWNYSGDTFIYIAIRRGPMKTPTDGTTVFSPSSSRQTSSTSTPNYVSNFPVDLGLVKYYTAAADWDIGSRLTGQGYMHTNTTAAEANSTDWQFYYQNGFGQAGSASTDFAGWSFRRAPGFFDEVCYTGNSGSNTVYHNLGVTPELQILKCRNNAQTWWVLLSDPTQYMMLDATDGVGTATFLSSRNSTSFSFSGTANGANNNGSTFVSYLFASCPGVSKVGSYTGTGGTFTVNCGFTGGARFVLIKRTDSTGNWYVWDTARGMVAGTDPKLALNSTAAQTNANWVYTATTGFQVVGTDASINANGGSYIYLAIS